MEGEALLLFLASLREAPLCTAGQRHKGFSRMYESRSKVYRS